MNDDYNFLKITDSVIKILNKNKEELIIETPVCKIPFGLEYYTFNKKKNYYLQIEIDDEFEKKISLFESFILNKISIEHNTEYELKSQITKHNFYDSKLRVKVRQKYGKFLGKCLKNNTEISYFDIEKLDEAKFYLTGNIFLNNNILIVKWSIYSMRIINNL